MPSRSLPSLLRATAISTAIAIALFAAVEGSFRLAGRLRSGKWPQTRATSERALVMKISSAYERHPYYLVRGKPGSSLDVLGHTIRFDASGRRGVASLLPKPPGVFRILCIGGSTTFDLRALNDSATWPALLAGRLGPGFEVINAGFSGWTSVESLIALQLRDIDVQPDLTIAFSGLNDLQPASHRPFARDYSKGHAEFLPRVLGVDPIPISFASRFVFIEWLLNKIAPARDQTPGFSPVWRWSGSFAEDVTPEARETFERNLLSTIGVARAHGSRVLLATQAIRLRRDFPDDAGYVRSWIPGLSAQKAVSALASYNEAAHQVAIRAGVHFVDPFASGTFTDADFADPFHFSASGSARFADALAPVVREIAATPLEKESAP